MTAKRSGHTKEKSLLPLRNQLFKKVNRFVYPREKEERGSFEVRIQRYVKIRHTIELRISHVIQELSHVIFVGIQTKIDQQRKIRLVTCNQL